MTTDECFRMVKEVESKLEELTTLKKRSSSLMVMVDFSVSEQNLTERLKEGRTALTRTIEREVCCLLLVVSRTHELTN